MAALGHASRVTSQRRKEAREEIPRTRTVLLFLATLSSHPCPSVIRDTGFALDSATTRPPNSLGPNISSSDYEASEHDAAFKN